MEILCSSCGKKHSFSFEKEFGYLKEKFYCDDCFPKVRREYLENIKPIIDKKLDNIYRELEKFFSAGILRVIFTGEYVCICNISNWCYIALDYDYHNREYPVGYTIFNAKRIDEIMKNEEPFYKCSSCTPEEKSITTVYHFTDELFEAMKERKKDTDANGPEVSLEYEQELIEKYGAF